MTVHGQPHVAASAGQTLVSGSAARSIAPVWRQPVGNVLRALTRPLVRHWPIERCPGRLGSLHNLRVPGNVRPNPHASPAGSPNIKIIFRLLEGALLLDGDIAECGVWQASTLISIGLFVKQRGGRKVVLGFDSFEGLDQSVQVDIALGGRGDPRKQVGGFSNTSHGAVVERIGRFGLAASLKTVPGYFRESLQRYGDRRFCFVHLDCVIYESYKQCLEFFYPRMVPNGIILLDEYNDPPWPGCTKAVDEFLADKAEKVTEITSDNYVKYYVRKA